MNKTLLFITFAVLAALGIAGSVLLLIVTPDGYDRFTSFVLQILGLTTVAAGTFAALNIQGKKLEVVRKQTNGTLIGLLQTISKKDAELAAYKARFGELEMEEQA